MKPTTGAVVRAGERWGRAVVGVIIASLIVTALTGLLTFRARSAATSDELLDRTHAARNAIERRVSRYAELLFSTRSLFAADGDVTRDTFHRFAAGLRERFPGMRALEWVTPVPSGDLEDFVAQVRSDRSLDPLGYPEFDVVNAGDADDHYIITYVEPLEGNEAAFGLDLSFNTSRLAAVRDARATGDLVASEPIELVQEPGSPAFILLLGVYAGGEVPRTEAARVRAFRGVVVAVLNIPQMMEGILGSTTGIDLELHDVGATLTGASDPVSPENLLYDTRPADAAFLGGSGRAVADLDVGGRRWRLLTSYADGATPFPPALTAAIVALIVLGLGVAVVTVLSSSVRARSQAEVLADEMTDDLSRREAQLARANHELTQQRSALEQAVDRLRGFARTVAHDLRTPLTTVLGFTELLLRSDDDARDRRDILETIHRGGRQMNEIVDGLLADAIEARAVESVDLDDVVDWVLDAVAVARAESAAVIRVDRPLVTVLGSEASLRTILQNLVTNALKFTRPGVAPEVLISADAADGFATVTVADNGRGIPLIDRDRVFRAGERLGAPERGTGLGLAGVRAAVDQLGGTIIAFDSDLGGIAFAFTVPLVSTSDAPGHDAHAAGTPEARLGASHER